MYCTQSVGHVGLLSTNCAEWRTQVASERSAHHERAAMKPSASYGVRSRTFESVKVSSDV